MMMKTIFQTERCILCHQEQNISIGWVQLFSKESPIKLCEICERKLEKISGETCKICGRGFNLINGEYRYKSGETCFDCIRWEEDPNWRGLLERNISLFHYNDFLKEVLSMFKYRGDYVVAKVFREFIASELKPHHYDYLVPIPLSKERLFERGFNQAEALIIEAGLSPSHLLARLHGEKQSKKSREERIHIEQVFHLNSDLSMRTNDSPGQSLKEPIIIAGKRILLFDDIYTTGSTLRHAAKVLKSAGAKSISSFTLARG